jgi:hypothetical protein
VDATHEDRVRLVRVSRLAAVWALGYGLYRWYYALGGTVGMPGTPASWEQWRRINAAGGVLLFLAVLLPIVSAEAWERRGTRPLLLAFCWIAAVGCVSHALIDMLMRVASLAGTLTIPYPFWRTIDRRRADLQDLFFNEPWFLLEGLLWAVIAWHGALRVSPRRSWWVASALAASAAATVWGLLTAFGVVERVILG